MNIMYLDHDPETCAKLLCNRHLLAQIVEGWTALRELGNRHHPVTRWAQANQAQWQWLRAFAVACCEEYTRRFGKVHKCHKPLVALHCPVEAEGEFTPPAWHGDYPDYASYLAAKHEEWAKNGKPARWVAAPKAKSVDSGGSL